VAFFKNKKGGDESMTISGLGSAASIRRVMSAVNSGISATQKMPDLFQKIDGNCSDSIIKAQFKQTFQSLNPPLAFKAMEANAIFNKLDSNAPADPSVPYSIFLFRATVFQPLNTHWPA
jgi:Ca2+-binding EF-hand superfamily protein